MKNEQYVTHKCSWNITDMFLAPFNITTSISFFNPLLIYVFLLYFTDLNESPQILL